MRGTRRRFRCSVLTAMQLPLTPALSRRERGTNCEPHSNLQIAHQHRTWKSPSRQPTDADYSARLLIFRSRETASAIRATTSSTSSAVLNRPRPKRTLLPHGVLRQREAAKHMAGLRRGRGAGAARAQGDVGDVQQQRLALDAGEAHIEVARQTQLRQFQARPVERDAGDGRREPRKEAVSQRPQPRRLRGLFVEAEFDGPGHADDARHIERAAAKAAFLPAALDLRLQTDARLAAADVQPADALRTIHLVGGKTQQIDFELSNVDRHLAHRLGGVAVQQHAAAAAEFARSRPAAGSRRSRCWPTSRTRGSCRRGSRRPGGRFPAVRRGSGACTTGSNVISNP